MQSIKTNLIHIDRLNHHLADELAKLPEIREYKTDSSCLALDNLIEIYRFAPERFDRMFESMDTTGLPAHRDYCSPLQAFFWLVQDEKLEASGVPLGLNIINETDADGRCQPKLLSSADCKSYNYSSTGAKSQYSLEGILDAAWNGESRLILSSKIHQIIQRIQTSAESEEYAILLKRHDDLQMQGYIMDDYLKRKEIFNKYDFALIEKAIQESRWKQFYSVANRLNSPELISYYINRYFFFQKTPASGVYFTFLSKRAQCTDAAYFAQFMLERSGYITFMRSVKWDNDSWDGLHTGAGVILEDGSYLLVSNYTGINPLSGPFANLDNLDEKLSCGKKIIDRKWGAYYPPRYY